MKDEILKLIEFANIDKEIDEIKLQLEEKPETLRQLELAWIQAKQEFDTLHQEFSTKDTLLKKLQIDLKFDSEKMIEKEARLHQIKTQKEFQAVNKEITDTRRMNSEKESQILKLMDETEPLKPKVLQLQEVMEKCFSSFNQEKEEFTKIQQELSNKITGIADKKSAFAIRKDILAKYDRIHQSIKPALARVKAGSCSECFMRISPQLQNQMVKYLELYNCPSCGRILHLS